MASSTLTTTRPSDVAISADGTRLYAAGTDGNLRVYDLSTHTLIATWPVGTQLGGIDLSPDGSFLMVTETSIQGFRKDGSFFYSTSIVYRVDTATGAKQAFAVEDRGGDHTFYDVAILNNGEVLLTQSAYSAFLPLWKLNLATGTFTATTENYSVRSVLETSLDRSHALFAVGDSSFAPIYVYQAGTGIVSGHSNYQDGVQGYNLGNFAISEEAGLIVQNVTGHTHVYDLSLNYKFNLSTLHPGYNLGANLAGLTFDATGANLYILSDDSDTITQISTADWSVVRIQNVGSDVGEAQLGRFGNRLTLSPDGKTFIISTSTGIELRTNEAAPSDPDAPGNTLGGPGDDVLTGGSGGDTLIGDAGKDTLTGLAGDDFLYSHLPLPLSQSYGYPYQSNSGDIYADRDILNGGDGSDLFFAGFGDDVDGGANDSDGDRLWINFQGATAGVTADFRPLATGAAVTIGTGTIVNIEQVAVIDGSEHDDFLAGWGSLFLPVPNAASIYGHGGNDHIIASYWAGWGDSALYGGDGNDIIDLRPAQYSPRAYGGAGDDRIIGGYGYESLYGGTGNDVLISGPGYDRLFGEAGDDLLYFGVEYTASDGVDGGDGSDALVLQGNYSITLGALAGIETLRLLSGSDSTFVTPAPGGSFTYFVTISDSTAATGGFVVDASGLAAGEALAFDGTAESSASLTVRGGAGADRIGGGSGADDLSGGLGNDMLISGSGHDRLFGEAGDDLLYFGAEYTDSDGVDGGDGSDALVLHGTYSITLGALAGIETLRLLSGADSFVTPAPGGSFSYFVRISDSTAGAGGFVVDASALAAGETLTFDGAAESSASLTVRGGGGADRIGGGHGADDLTGGLGNDVLLGGQAADRLDGGGGIDTVDYASESGTLGLVVNLNESLSFSDGSARTLAPGQATDSFGNVDTLAGIENVNTGGGDDWVLGSNADNRISTGAGNDVLNGAGGADTMIGGVGNDIYYVDNGADSVAELAGEGTDEVRTSLLVYELGANVENLTSVGGFGRSFRDNALNNVITGDDGGADFIVLQAGGADRVLGLGGNDTILFGSTFSTADFVDGGAGTDTLALQGNYTLTFGTGLVSNIAGLENIALLSGVNTRFGEPGTNRYSYNFTMLDSNVAAGQVLRINGGNLVAGEHFTFDGRAETDGGFVVYAGLGTDIFRGGSQSDVFFFGDSLSYAPGDLADGGAGYDGLFFRGDYVIDFTQPGYENGLISIENITLSSASDERHQRGGDGEFDYHVILSDAIVQPGAVVTINGGLLMANETMYLDASRETNGHLRLFGGAANDTLLAGEGNDLIYGGLGADQLAGGGAADTFRYDETADSTASATDRITGFTPNVDRIDLSRIDADSFATGDQAFRWIGQDAFSGQGAASAGELRARFAGGLWFVEGDTDGNGTADLVISMTTPADAAPTAADFFF